jgi:hypothetical protein
MTPRLLIYAYAGLVVIGCALALLLAANCEIVNRDAGFYIPIARWVASGLTPVLDFPVAYTPGWAYAFALLGNDALGDPLLVKSAIYAVHLGNTAIVWALLRRLGRRAVPALAVAATYLAWTISLDGTYVVIEPLLNTCILLSFLLLTAGVGPFRALAAGALLGAAIMVKQYAVCLAPGLVLLVLWAPDPVGASRSRLARLRAVALFSAAIAVPFLAFAIQTAQDPVYLARYFITFGGYVGDYADAVDRWHQLYTSFVVQYPILVVVLALAAWLLWIEPTRINAAMTLLLLGAMAPLAIRGYPHYVQLAAPWVALLGAQMFVAFNRGPRTSVALKRQAIAVIAGGAMLLTLQNVRHGSLRCSSGELAAQERITAQMAAALPHLSNTAALDWPQLYFFTEATPPNNDFFADHRVKQSRGLPDFVVVTDQGPQPIAAVAAQLTSNGFFHLRTLQAERRTIAIYARR